MCAEGDFCSVLSCIFSYNDSGDLKCTVYTCSMLSFDQMLHLSGVHRIYCICYNKGRMTEMYRISFPKKNDSILYFDKSTKANYF